MRTIVHISDIHFGRVDDATLEPLVQTINEVSPDVVVVSGDLTQRAREEQFIEARTFLDRLPSPQIVVPGNHDVPMYRIHERIFSPLKNYRRYICDDLDPFYHDDEIAIAGINTARSLTLVNGRINEQQLDLLASRMKDLPDETTRIVVTHHPLDLPPTYTARRLVGRATLAMQSMARCRIDMLLAGHWHISHAGDTRIRHPIPGYAALVVQAGTATSTRGRGEPNAFNILHVDRPLIVVDRYHWNREISHFERFSSERFRESEDGWRLEQKADEAGYEKTVM
jgi:3',5'-cyclic AMP phosphodiesterase CpdA